jgi:sortase (surface protein transpeptidase)
MIIFVLILLCLLAMLLMICFRNDTSEIESQEKVSRLIAEEYLIYVSQQENADNQEDTDADQVPASDFDYQDNHIYSRYDESYAWGHVDCVLEIPALDLRQSIFSGTVEQIEHDLKHWLPVTARANYMLGSSHYCIYIHNPTDKSIRISYAQELLKTTDYMVVTQGNTVYFYEITAIFPEWRNKCTEEYVNNMNIPSDKMYIFTCGRGEWQGRNIVIEGTVHNVYNAKDWNENKDHYVAEYKKDIAHLDVDEPAVQEQLFMSTNIKNNSLYVAIYNKNYISVNDCTIAILDTDGHLIENIQNPIEYQGAEILIPQLPSGEYYIGVYENNTEYLDPLPCKITIDKNLHVEDVVVVDDSDTRNDRQSETMRKISIISLSVSIIFGTIIIVKNRKRFWWYVN